MDSLSVSDRNRLTRDAAVTSAIDLEAQPVLRGGTQQRVSQLDASIEESSRQETATHQIAQRRDIACHIVMLNVFTFVGLMNGSSHLKMGRRDLKYEKCLTEEEVDLFTFFYDQEDVRFEAAAVEYVSAMTDDAVIAHLDDLRTSEFYSDLIDIRLKMYRAAIAHAALISRSKDFEIPERYQEFCDTYLEYVEYTVIEEFENRSRLKAVVKRADRLLSPIKLAAQDGSLGQRSMGKLKKKVAALQEHYPDAHAEIHGSPRDLFDPSIEPWWDPTIVSGPDFSGINASDSAVGAYTTNVRSALNFVVPTVCLLTCIPVALAWQRNPAELGTVDDANFYQLLAESTMQLLGLATLLWPARARLARHSRTWIWVLAGAAVVSVVTSILVYLFVSTGWSAVLSFGGTAAQAFILLQVMNDPSV